MALAPLVEELLEHARNYDAFIESANEFGQDREKDEAYVKARQGLIDGAFKIRQEAMTPDQRLHQYMTRVSLACCSSGNVL